MRSVKRRFSNIRRRNPAWSTLVCFAEAIKDQRFSKRTVYLWFNRLVDKEEFPKEERVKLLRYLANLKPP
jgi:hypothetical protein